MGRTIGVLAAEHIAVGLVENHQLAGPVRVFPERGGNAGCLTEMPTEEIVQHIADQIAVCCQDEPITAVGVGFPGIICEGKVEDSPNLPQTKGQNLGAALASAINRGEGAVQVLVLNDADAMAAGIAATRGHLDKLIRVWFLGSGIGYGHYPTSHNVGEGGHTVVTLDSKENFCRCGGVGHLEGIMGHRAMRLRFLDLEPEEVFEHAKEGDARCGGFVELWHRALAAATATSIHLEGPGKFYVSGPNARFTDVKLVQIYLGDMVKMSPLQGSTVEVITTSDDIAIVGAAISAGQLV